LPAARAAESADYAAATGRRTRSQIPRKSIQSGSAKRTTAHEMNGIAAATARMAVTTPNQNGNTRVRSATTAAAAKKAARKNVATTKKPSPAHAIRWIADVLDDDDSDPEQDRGEDPRERSEALPAPVRHIAFGDQRH
jgi:hypothetical protein